MSESKPDPFLGRTFDGFRIESVIGSGGMGTVYKATQLSLGRAVALKILPADLAQDPQFLERFHREADALSRLAHPNIVTVYDRGEIECQPYLVMEFVEGTSLREIVRNGPLPPADALRIVSSVLAALDHAHANDIVHRDIKPENVLLARGDVVKVADFGLSRLLGPEGQTRLTRTHLVLGTYEYMAPEQRERAREADSRSDLFATGVVLYEMLTGELPIGRFEMPSHRRPEECDGRVDQLIEKSLDKNPDARYQRASEMAEAVSVILDRPQVENPPPLPLSQSGGPHPSYKPVRFEHHIDNVATMDHVLGTVCYVIGFMALFGVGISRRIPWSMGAIPFFMFFIGGWYLRDTAENLRRYRPAARTAQAAIAILVAFTGILVPLSIYSFWVLFSHRGRTYYEARGRGLGERDAARHTYRMLEEPFPYMAQNAPAPAAAPASPEAPRPSQIPVQSTVTSEVLDSEAPAERPSPRLSGFVKVGLIVLVLTTVVYGLMLASETGFDSRFFAGPAGAGVVLLVVGFFHALITPGVRGVWAALFWLGAAALAVLALATIFGDPWLPPLMDELVREIDRFF